MSIYRWIYLEEGTECFKTYDTNSSSTGATISGFYADVKDGAYLVFN